MGLLDLIWHTTLFILSFLTSLSYTYVILIVSNPNFLGFINLKSFLKALIVSFRTYPKVPLLEAIYDKYD